MCVCVVVGTLCTLHKTTAKIAFNWKIEQFFFHSFNSLLLIFVFFVVVVVVFHSFKERNKNENSKRMAVMYQHSHTILVYLCVCMSVYHSIKLYVFFFGRSFV